MCVPSWVGEFDSSTHTSIGMARRVLPPHGLLCADWLGLINFWIFNISNGTLCEIAGRFHSKKGEFTLANRNCKPVKFRQYLLPHFPSGPLVLLSLAGKRTAVYLVWDWTVTWGQNTGWSVPEETAWLGDWVREWAAGFGGTDLLGNQMVDGKIILKWM
jgi:hypothetical protein